MVEGLERGVETRASVLLKAANHDALYRQELNPAFVLAEYFGYLQRDPNTGPDTDWQGYDHWLGKLNDNGGDYHKAQMVRAFIDSIEYRKRFGPE